ncbi:hypothetical protein COV53_03135 [Candidatus Gottesmanbacteria bacterium CG11_big_fil_rev_8_21_14_0_20_37_11]|uniref:UDP-N-acetylmuramoyl-L-alanyl-D-glutamate--2, 6-diaminopimelate ligase n=2 Tax=Candidatus Gottesmaniibacteriota TaxID=1752720 RepID=A0A2M7RS91_9BACT|nr:MAG: hypothetical protein COX23_04145 [Candidatus Gottesmanbacteria bacterium CG23_combo_of_CG06-09_8_20_14_all_37_19]PIR08421.1 MAG: hypothetical protein COV53_03135 [Candidatus Gottesmanbacteria bacterium CG11_big_fil_rev_8_21_14_0_20_37_11]PIZ02925.1 MAG: UDP-N-acetylmuramoyl-L-alanyl-D-glutamate--2,6-diaminopimelate ligase [Candidatus Gottesmanbacteria bacterium CG_4_10_14_0_8_um_filter_37_24]
MFRRIKNIFHLINAFIAVIYYRFPARGLRIIGITGTSGKTTTTHIIYDILRNAGLRVSMISTVKAIINNKNYDTGFHVTTPSPFILQKFLREAADGASKIAIIEVTSHALDQNRIFGIPVEIAVITNISHEHLDYHLTLNNYRNIKAKIMNGAKYVILNKDDRNYDFLKNKAKGKTIGFSLNKLSDVNIVDHIHNINLPGKYNQYNILASKAVAVILGVPEKVIESSILDFQAIPGRMEEVKTNRSYKVIIDFAHKPDALEQVLIASKKMVKNNLIVVFGCAGLRDRQKRSMMGEIAIKLADYVVLTAEDPRTEDVRKIINEISTGCIKAGGIIAKRSDIQKNILNKKRKYYWQIPDRQEAINFVLRNLASKGDLILICGKGHEKSMCYGKVEYPWDERKAIEKALYGSVKTTS